MHRVIDLKVLKWNINEESRVVRCGQPSSPDIERGTRWPVPVIPWTSEDEETINHTNKPLPMKMEVIEISDDETEEEIERIRDESPTYKNDEIEEEIGRIIDESPTYEYDEENRFIPIDENESIQEEENEEDEENLFIPIDENEENDENAENQKNENQENMEQENEQQREEEEEEEQEQVQISHLSMDFEWVKNQIKLYSETLFDCVKEDWIEKCNRERETAPTPTEEE
jgi:hypothetical protein